MGCKGFQMEGCVCKFSILDTHKNHHNHNGLQMEGGGKFSILETHKNHHINNGLEGIADGGCVCVCVCV